MRSLLVRLIAALAFTGAAGAATIGLASSCGAPAHPPELPDPTSPHARPPALSPSGGHRVILDAGAPKDGAGPERS